MKVGCINLMQVMQVKDNKKTDSLFLLANNDVSWQILLICQVMTKN